jgi:hypothetical protein
LFETYVYAQILSSVDLFPFVTEDQAHLRATARRTLTERATMQKRLVE